MNLEISPEVQAMVEGWRQAKQLLEAMETCANLQAALSRSEAEQRKLAAWCARINAKSIILEMDVAAWKAQNDPTEVSGRFGIDD